MWMAEVNGMLVDIREMPRQVQVIAFEKGMIPTSRQTRTSPEYRLPTNYEAAVIHQKRSRRWSDLVMISATGFLAEFHRHQPPRHDRKETVRFPCVQTDPSRKPAALHHGRQEAGCDRQG